MTTLLKKKWFLPAAVAAVVAVIGVLVWAFHQDSYASIKDCDANPPFEGVYWGMTIPEFCEAMGVEESDLVKAEPWTYDDWNGAESLKRHEEYYNVPAEEMPLYEHYENHFDLYLTGTIFETENYYLGDKEQTIRVVFTDETTWNGKTIPPLLCFILFQIPHEQLYETSNAIALYYGVEALPEGALGIGRFGSLNPKLTHEAAKTLSYMYSCGMAAEEIDAYNVHRMSREEMAAINTPVYNAILDRHPSVNVSEKVDEKYSDYGGWYMEWDSENAIVHMSAGYLAYYEWFLNELT